jgi:hypothetical protein
MKVDFTLNSIVMASVFKRSFDRVLIDLFANKTSPAVLMENLVDSCTEFYVRILEKRRVVD